MKQLTQTLNNLFNQSVGSIRLSDLSSDDIKMLGNSNFWKDYLTNYPLSIGEWYFWLNNKDSIIIKVYSKNNELYLYCKNDISPIPSDKFDYRFNSNNQAILEENTQKYFDGKLSNLENCIINIASVFRLTY